MKASELVKALCDAIDEYGDREVVGSVYLDAVSVVTYVGQYFDIDVPTVARADRTPEWQLMVDTVLDVKADAYDYISIRDVLAEVGIYHEKPLYTWSSEELRRYFRELDESDIEYQQIDPDSPLYRAIYPNG